MDNNYRSESHEFLRLTHIIYLLHTYRISLHLFIVASIYLFCHLFIYLSVYVYLFLINYTISWYKVYSQFTASDRICFALKTRRENNLPFSLAISPSDGKRVIVEICIW